MAEFTGERLIPGQVDVDLLNEHMARYTFAVRLARGKRVLDAGCGAGYGSAELAQVAATRGIPLQDAVFPRYASDGHALIMSGVPTAVLAFATRYTHSPYEMLHERDVQQCVDLLRAFVTG